MVKAELGTKRSCPNCAARFYDLNKTPIECPKCGTAFIAEALLPSKAEQPAQPQPVAREKVEVEEDETADVDTISLEDVEEGDDETAAIKDVDLGDDPAAVDDDDDTFLEEEEENEANVTGIIVGGKPENEEI